MKETIKLTIEDDPNVLQMLGLEGVTCPKCGSTNIMHWGLEEIIDAETDESHGFVYTYECRENSPYHSNKPYMWEGEA